MLTLQAMGLGGWMFDGIDRFSMLGASGDPEVPGLGFRYDEDERWVDARTRPACEGVFEAFCPPHYDDMAAAVEAFCERKFGAGRPVQRRHAGRVERERARCARARRSTTSEFREPASRSRRSTCSTRSGSSRRRCRALMILNYVQAHHLDLDFYDHKFRPGSYLRTHAEHMEKWH